ncbi:hypothetical protein [Anaeromicrobium sediminis]|uniref:N-acetyltransferase domain-containing protein n=1 Tax=Anaeromicrobium sediminis TaxID=1478221 RepID=A0A267MNM3_9FIRM|nr:hypothetical protein [Anaeromicrobium sediminis]PAB61179.1 hypothetical protein CCE28_01770 [Anaeromicrobium sediminis]
MLEMYLEKDPNIIKTFLDKEVDDKNEFVVLKEKNEILGVLEFLQINPLVGEIKEIRIMNKEFSMKDGLVKASLNFMFNRGIFFAINKENNLKHYGFEKDNEDLILKEFKDYYSLDLNKWVNNSCCKGGCNGK